MPSHPILLALERQRIGSTVPSAAPVALGHLDMPDIPGPAAIPRSVRPVSHRVSQLGAPASAPLLGFHLNLGHLWGIVIASAAFLALVIILAFAYYG